MICARDIYKVFVYKHSEMIYRNNKFRNKIQKQTFKNNRIC